MILEKKAKLLALSVQTLAKLHESGFGKASEVDARLLTAGQEKKTYSTTKKSGAQPTAESEANREQPSRFFSLSTAAGTVCYILLIGALNGQGGPIKKSH